MYFTIQYFTMKVAPQQILTDFQSDGLACPRQIKSMIDEVMDTTVKYFFNR